MNYFDWHSFELILCTVFILIQRHSVLVSLLHFLIPRFSANFSLYFMQIMLFSCAMTSITWSCLFKYDEKIRVCVDLSTRKVVLNGNTVLVISNSVYNGCLLSSNQHLVWLRLHFWIAVMWMWYINNSSIMCALICNCDDCVWSMETISTTGILINDGVIMWVKLLTKYWRTVDELLTNCWRTVPNIQRCKVAFQLYLIKSSCFLACSRVWRLLMVVWRGTVPTLSLLATYRTTLLFDYIVRLSIFHAVSTPVLIVTVSSIITSTWSYGVCVYLLTHYQPFNDNRWSAFFRLLQSCPSTI